MINQLINKEIIADKKMIHMNHCKNALPIIFKISIVAIILSVFCHTDSLFAKDDVRINILAVNPSDKDRIEADVMHYLPPELKPEDVIDKSGLEVKFDSDKNAYYLSGKVALEPNETKTIGIMVKNVWVVPEEELASKREEVEKNLQSLQGTDYYETAKLLHDKVLEKLSALEEERGKAVGMRQRIELYRSQMKQLDLIGRDVISLDSMRKLKSAPDVRVAKLVITAENPSDETKKMTVRSMLPKELTPEDVVDKQDFLLLYDSTNKGFALEKEDTLEGHEKRKYEILVKDVWYIAQDQIDLVRKQTDSVLSNLKGSSFEKFSVQQGEFIYKTLNEIVELQAEVADSPVLDDRMRAFVLNSSRFDLATKKLKDLQDLLLEIPLKRQETTIERIRRAVQSLKHVVDVIKVGFQPNLSTTWWIILGIIAFLFILATSFYVIWVSKLKDVRTVKKKDKKEPSEKK